MFVYRLVKSKEELGVLDSLGWTKVAAHVEKDWAACSTSRTRPGLKEEDAAAAAAAATRPSIFCVRYKTLKADLEAWAETAGWTMQAAPVPWDAFRLLLIPGSAADTSALSQTYSKWELDGTVSYVGLGPGETDGVVSSVGFVEYPRDQRLWACFWSLVHVWDEAEGEAGWTASMVLKHTLVGRRLRLDAWLAALGEAEMEFLKACLCGFWWASGTGVDLCIWTNEVLELLASSK